MIRKALLVFALLAAALFAASQFALRPAPGVQYLSAAAAKSVLAEQPELVVLDVRTAREFSGGHLEGALNVDYFDGDFAQNVRALDRNATYLVHCATGARSRRAALILEREGFQNLIHLDGGYRAWQEAGGAVAGRELP